jgi:hypothetical protein
MTSSARKFQREIYDLSAMPDQDDRAKTQLSQAAKVDLSSVWSRTDAASEAKSQAPVTLP